MNVIKKAKSMVKHLYCQAYIKNHETSYGKKGKCLFVNKGTESLLVIFSAFTGEIPRYNYFYSFRNLNISQLYVLDNYGYKGSYYLYENGDNYPEKEVIDLIHSVVEKNNINNLITAGTSKGGTAAIYFGLVCHANHIFSGACQYYIGSYLNRDKHKRILAAMQGNKDEDSFVRYLDDVIKNVIINYRENHGAIHLLYSKEELTYERQTVFLLDELEKNKYKYSEKVESFQDHSIVGNYFIPYITQWIVDNCK